MSSPSYQSSNGGNVASTSSVTMTSAATAQYQSSATSALSSPHQSVPRRAMSRSMFFNELSQCLFDFVIQLLPTAEEMAVKEDVRKLLEKLIKTIEPDSRLLSFGSTANGFSLRNSDMDLCCLIDSEAPPLQASDLVTMLGNLLERETKFHVKTLPFARIPIVKLNLDPSPGLPFGIACDIGFENRLALENTRLLLSYAMVDPTRVRTLVLFLKVWTKRRKINSPYRGTLSSYGYVLLVIYFLVHVKNPPVLPNLQQMPPLRPMSQEDMMIGEHNIWFFDDTDVLRQKWQSSNTETVAELLVDFFKYYSRDFSYNTGVASIRSGLLKKESKGWMNDFDGSRFSESNRDRNRLCIEDPFETNYNVSRTVTKDGLYTIRGEFMRASRILAARPERAVISLAQLCEERDDELVPASSQPYPHSGAPPRLAPFPAQTPYTVGASRPAGPGAVDRLSPPRRLFEPLVQSADSGHTRNASEEVAEGGTPPQHMAPKRSKYTSPPPLNASPADHDRYASSLGLGLSLATSSTEARQTAPISGSSSSTSDGMTDEDGRSNPSDSQPTSPSGSPPKGSPRKPDSLRHPASPKLSPKGLRGRIPLRPEGDASTSATVRPRHFPNAPRRSSSGPPALSSPPSQGTPTPTLPISVPPPSSPSTRTKPIPQMAGGGHFPTLSPSPLNVPPKVTVPLQQPRSAWPYSPNQQHQYQSRQYFAQTSPQYPASITIYRSQPQIPVYPQYSSARIDGASTSQLDDTIDSLGGPPVEIGKLSDDGSSQLSRSPAVTAQPRTGPLSPSTSVTSSANTSPAKLSGSSTLAPLNSKPGSSSSPSSSAISASSSRRSKRASFDPSAGFRIPTTTAPMEIPIPTPPASSMNLSLSLPPSPPDSTRSSPRGSPGGRHLRGNGNTVEPLFRTTEAPAHSRWER